MAEYIEREAATKALCNSVPHSCDFDDCDRLCPGVAALDSIPAADVIDEENVLKFYYVRSTNDYWIGRRVGNFYYAEFEPKLLHWVWTHSRYLPWGEHVISQTSTWKEHTYPTEPEEIPFSDWMRGFVKKYFSADALTYPKGRWVPEKEDIDWGCSVIRYRCSNCGRLPHYDKEAGKFLRSAFCPKCGARMEDDDG